MKVALVVVFILGMFWGSHVNDPETKYKVIHKTDTVTKTVTKTNTEVTVPESCMLALGWASNVNTLSGQAYAGLSKVEDIVSEATVAIGTQDANRLVDARDAAYGNLTDTRKYRLDMMQAQAEADRYLKSCKEELEKVE